MDELATLEPTRLADIGELSGLSRSTAHRGRIDRERDDAGGLVVKSGRGGDRAGLRREAEVMRVAGNNSLVRLVELRDHPDLTELVLRDTGGPSLAAALGTTARPSESLRLLAEACDTVARLHATGWAHGRIAADHVLLTPRGRMRLCSLRDAVPIDLDASVARNDRSALLRMVDDWVRSPTTSRSTSTPVARLCAVRVARSTRRLPDDPDPILLARILRRCSPRPGPRARAALIGLAISLPLAVTSAIALGRPDVPERSVAPASTRSTTTTPPTEPARTPASTTTAPATDPTIPCATPVASGGADVDGDGCADVVEVDGNTVAIGPWRFRLGAPEDVVAVGDWDCDGRATAAVLRRSSGEVHVFDGWATDSNPVTGRLVDSVTDATGISSPTDGCGPPLVTHTDGSTTEVTLR